MRRIDPDNPLDVALFLWNDPIVQEMHAWLWPEPETAPHGAMSQVWSERRGVYTCRICGRRTVRVAECSAAVDDGPCEAAVCLWCGYSCLDWGSQGPVLRWQCRTCGHPDTSGCCPGCQTYGAWYHVEHLSYCVVCEYRKDHRLFWGTEEPSP